MRVRIDRELCQGHGECAVEAPQVFRLDAEGRLEVLAEEIERCPQGVLVDVYIGDEHIRVVKGWRSFEVTVDSDDVDVKVSVPARLASRMLDVL